MRRIEGHAIIVLQRNAQLELAIADNLFHNAAEIQNDLLQTLQAGVVLSECVSLRAHRSMPPTAASPLGLGMCTHTMAAIRARAPIAITVHMAQHRRQHSQNVVQLWVCIGGGGGGRTSTVPAIWISWSMPSCGSRSMCSGDLL